MISWRIIEKCLLKYFHQQKKRSGAYLVILNLKDNFCQIFIKTYVVSEAILMSTLTIDFYEEISKIIP